jgi:DNA-binding response OmpR family regulator
VKFAILRLRRKLGWSATVSPIEAVRGFGYRYLPHT